MGMHEQQFLSIGPSKLIELFYNSSFPAKSWQDSAGIDIEQQNKKLPLLGIEPIASRSSVSHSANCAKSLFGCLCQSLKPYKVMPY